MNSASNVSSPAEVSIPIVIAPGEPARALSVHPAAALFPLMKGPEFGLLVEDIDEHGLREPIVMYQGLVLDGRNRLRACELAGVEPRFVEWEGTGSPLAFVLSRNLHRRHLNESQRAMIGARARLMFEEEAAERKRASQYGHDSQSNTVEGAGDEKPRENTVTANLRSPARTASADAAELLNVSERSVESASRVLKSGDEQVIAAVASGDVAVSDAAAVANRPKEEQRRALEARRQGRARTLRQAAEQEGDGNSNAADSGEKGGAWSQRRRIKSEARGFARELDKLYRRLDALSFACGGANEHTQRMRECLRCLIDYFHDFVHHFLPKEK
jgi:ParB-like chromosome segregation protein Spo0J